MGHLSNRILTAIAADRFVVSDHADNQLRERSIMAWQVVDGAAHARLLSERPWTLPNPSIELDQSLADGTPIKVVWAWLDGAGMAKLVTVHFYDR